MRDHTSKAFQLKYKDFCIIGLLGKNQVEVKDNHAHTTKVHRRGREKDTHDRENLPTVRGRTSGKSERVREGRKAVPANKMPELGWGIAESDIQTIPKTTQLDNQQTPYTLQIMITIAILIAAVLEIHQNTHPENPTTNKNSSQSNRRSIQKESTTLGSYKTSENPTVK